MQILAATLEVRALVLVFALALLCMDAAQLVCLLVGAACYALLQVFGAPPPPRRPPKHGKLLGGKPGKLKQGAVATAAVWEPAPSHSSTAPLKGVATVREPLFSRGPAAPLKVGLQCRSIPEDCNVAAAGAPVAPPSSPSPSPPLAASRSGTSACGGVARNGWDAEVEELLSRLTPTPRSQEAVRGVARFVEWTLSGLVPEVEVLAFASGDWTASHGACRVAVPEVEVVVRAEPVALAARLRGGHGARSGADPQKLLKLAIRAFTERLVATGHVKFRRSAFRGSEPKVALMVVTSLGLHAEAMPIDFSVNAATPLRHAALLTVCERAAPRSISLVLLVRRWAKDRGVCHAARGHLSSYAWSLLVAYFLQVGYLSSCSKGQGGGGGWPSLPPLDFAFACGMDPDIPGRLLGSGDDEAMLGAPRLDTSSEISGKSPGTLFADFVHFYSKVFRQRTEAVCVRLGARTAPSGELPLHVVVDEVAVPHVAEVVPSIEDPLEPRRNLGAELSFWGWARMKEELSRACRLASRGASLGELLEPWSPPAPSLEESEGGC